MALVFTNMRIGIWDLGFGDLGFGDLGFGIWNLKIEIFI